MVTDGSTEFKRETTSKTEKIIGLVYWNGLAVISDLIFILTNQIFLSILIL